MLATNPASGRNRQRRVGEGHLGPTRDSVNGFFAVIFQKLEISRNSAIPDQSQACLLGLLSAILWGQRSLTCRDSPQKRMIPASNFPHGDSRNESIHHPNDSRTPSAPCALWFERRRLCPTAYRLMEPLIRSRKIRECLCWISCVRILASQAPRRAVTMASVVRVRSWSTA